MKEKIIKIPESLSEAEVVEWMHMAFKKIIDVCKLKGVKDMTFIIDYGR